MCHCRLKNTQECRLKIPQFWSWPALPGVLATNEEMRLDSPVRKEGQLMITCTEVFMIHDHVLIGQRMRPSLSRDRDRRFSTELFERCHCRLKFPQSWSPRTFGKADNGRQPVLVLLTNNPMHQVLKLQETLIETNRFCALDQTPLPSPGYVDVPDGSP